MEEKLNIDIKQMKFDEVEPIIESGDSDLLRTVLETGLFNDINKPKSLHGPTLLMIACQTGFIDCVKVLLEYTTDINYLNQNDSVLSYACRSGSVEMVHFIIASGFEINDEILKNLFRSEILMKNTDIVTILIDYIQDVNYAYNTFISSASRAGNVTIVRLLLERGANPNEECNSSIIATSSGGHIEVVKLLLAWGPVDKRPSQDMLVGALVNASRSGHLDVVRYLFEYGITDTAALTDALRRAVECNHVAAYLIDKGADINTTMTDDVLDEFSLLTHACCNDFTNMVQLLLNRGADPNAVDPIGYRPLKAALHHTEILKLLLEAGADPNLHFANGSTALLGAMRSVGENAEVLTQLLLHGADPNLAHAHTTVTPLMLASFKGYINLVKLLLEYGADVTQVDVDGGSVLDLLARIIADPALVELCLQYKDTNRTDAKPILK